MFRGYLTSREFMGERVPQHIQNQIIRDFCSKNDLHYLLSATEYSMKSSTLMLSQLVDELSTLNGVVFYSLFQLPVENKLRNFFINQFLKKKKIMYFAVEDLKIKNIQDKERIDKIWMLKLKIDKCPKYIKIKQIYYE